MKKRMVPILLLTLALLLALAACGGAADPPATGSGGADVSPAADGKSYKLLFANFMPADGDFENDVLDYMNEQMLDKSGGRLSLDIKSGGSLVAVGDTLDGVESGVADMGITYMATSPGRFPVSSIFELPYLYASGESAAHAFSDFMNEYAGDITEFDGVRVLMYYSGGPGVLLTNKPVTTVDGMKGMQVRTNSTLALVVDAIGGTPVTMSMTETYEGLRTGVVDAYIGAVETISSYALYEVTQYATFYPLLNATFSMMINEDVYNGLPADLQQVLDEVVADAWSTRVCPFFEQTGMNSYNIAKEKGMEFLAFDEGEIDQMLELSQRVTDDYAKQLDSMGYDGAGMIARCHELLDQYNAQYPNPYTF